MVKKLHISIISILMIGLMFSCSTSNDVASNRGIQKRKYNKGFYVEKGPKLGGETKNVELVENENTVEENTVAVDVPAERISSTPEVIYVEEIEESIVEVSPETVVDNDVEEVIYQDPTTTTAQQTFIAEETIADQKTIQKLNKRGRSILKKAFIQRDKEQLNAADDKADAILYYILAIFIPFLAVGLVTDWDVLLVVVSLILTLFFWLPGIIHAFIVISNNT